MKDKNYSWLIGLLIVVSTTALYQRSDSIENEPFQLNLNSGTVTNLHELPVQVVEGPASGQAVLRLNLFEYKGALIRVSYDPDQDPSEWSLNIGDSRSNNGYSGDGGDQTHDSEVQILGTSMSVWGSDVMVKKEGRQLHEVRDFVRPGQTVEFEIRDEFVKWKSPQGSGELRSDFLFALSDQPEKEGVVNRDIFVGLNRVVANPFRSGQGVGTVEIEMLK